MLKRREERGGRSIRRVAKGMGCCPGTISRELRHDASLPWQYSPKSRTLFQVTPEQLQAVMNRLNDRQRKRLGCRTPKEALLDAIFDEGSVTRIA